jgi:transcriptional regulator with XRE-family HTH domain
MAKKQMSERDAMKKEFKRHFLAARIDAGISQIKLAKMTGISNSTISNYEVGKTFPDEKNLAKLVKALPNLASHIKGQKVAPTTKAETKTSIIETSKVTSDQARVAFMRSLVSASQGLKDLTAQAEKVGVSKDDTQAMLKELGVSLQ